MANFVSFIEGTMENSVKSLGTPYYNGLKFHRVIENFMIQGGMPNGNGMGDPGYKFQDEFHPDLKTIRFYLWQTLDLIQMVLSFL